MADYSQMSTEDFDRTLNKLVAQYGVSWLMSLPGVYEIVSEEINNDVLDEWAKEHPDLAYPEEAEE